MRWIIGGMLGLFLFLTARDSMAQHDVADVVQGSWQGTLGVPGRTLRVVFHFIRQDDGTLSGSMDSPDQGATGIPLAGVDLEGRVLKVRVAAAAGSFEGTVADDGTRIIGHWSQAGQKLPLTLEEYQPAEELVSTPAPPKPAELDVDVTGSWLGTLKAGLTELRVVFHLHDAAGGGLTGTMDSPDQGATGIAIGSVSGTGRSLRIEVPAVGGVYEGEVGRDASQIVGQWTQSGRSFPLTLEAMGEEGTLELDRPQEPHAPFPYRSDEVRFTNQIDGVTLAGTVTIPSGAGPFPGAVLISGSGPQNRDEEIFGHKPFLVLADRLTRNGIAVIRYDDRGTGASAGDFGSATTEAFARDAQAAFRYLSTRPWVVSGGVGLIGHSEGGLAAIIASSGADAVSPAFLVLLATPGVSGEELLYAQMYSLAVASGASEDEARLARREQDHIYAILKAPKSDSAVASDLREYLTAESRPEGAMANIETLDYQVQLLTSPWFRHLLRYDPRPALKQIQCPVLALTGSKDLQVPPSESLGQIVQAVNAGGNNLVEAKELPGLNHLFQPSETGLPSEYGRINQTISPEVLEVVTTWIQAHARRM